MESGDLAYSRGVPAILLIEPTLDADFERVKAETHP